MPSRFSNLLTSCLGSVKRVKDVPEYDYDNLLSFVDLDRHAVGKFSMAIVQANRVLEDQGHVESGPFGTFVGVYDGHGGPEVSEYIKKTMFSHITNFALEKGGMSGDVLQMAFKATDEGFEALVYDVWPDRPQMASVGSCCLVGVIYNGSVYIANAGDSRVILGTGYRAADLFTAIQLTSEHNACFESVRQELKSLHPDDPNIVIKKHEVWRVKGIIQVSRAIGDVYLKKQEFNREPLSAQFLLPEPLRRPVITAEPAICVHKLQPQDRFLIFASDGLWEHMTNEKAVKIVNQHPHRGIARRLIRIALEEAAKKREMRYSDLRKIEKGVRRHFHDDITVIVIFLDHELLNNVSEYRPRSAVMVDRYSLLGGSQTDLKC